MINLDYFIFKISGIKKKYIFDQLKITHWANKDLSICINAMIIFIGIY